MAQLQPFRKLSHERAPTHTHERGASTFARYFNGKVCSPWLWQGFCRYHSHDTANHLLSKWCSPENFNLLTDFSFAPLCILRCVVTLSVAPHPVPFSCSYLFAVWSASRFMRWLTRMCSSYSANYLAFPPIESSSNNLHIGISKIAFWRNEAIRIGAGLRAIVAIRQTSVDVYVRDSSERADELIRFSRKSHLN